jgi:LmbE family N-acetylglucosaminyl deacetylase
MGYKTGIVDFTAGEMGTRGTAQDRENEAKAAAKILGVSPARTAHAGCQARQHAGKSHGCGSRDTSPQAPTRHLPHRSQRHPDHRVAGEIASMPAWPD